MMKNIYGSEDGDVESDGVVIKLHVECDLNSRNV